MNNKTLLIIFIALLIANGYIFVNKNDYAYKKQFSYAELYPSVSDLSVKEIVKENDSTIKFALANAFTKPNTWYAFVNNKPVDTFVENAPIIHLNEGLNSYTVRSNNFTDSIFARVEYIAAHKDKPAFVGLYSTNASSITNDNIEGDKNIFDNIGELERVYIKNLLIDSAGLLLQMNEEQKVKKIAQFLYKKIYKAAGTPTDSILGLNVFDQYNAANKGYKIWCGIYANIFNLFAATAGIKTRTVDISSTYKNVRGCNHVSNEYYLPSKKQWVAVDIMYNNVGYYNADGKLLNTVEVKNTKPQDSTIKILHADNDTFYKKPFSEMPAAFFDLYGREKDLLLHYKTTQKEYSRSIFKRFKNYVLPNYAFINYSDISITDNKRFYIKALFFWLLFSTSILIIIKKLFHIFKRKK